MDRRTIITSLGLDLLSKAQTGKKLIFTRVVMGSGEISEDTDRTQMTELVSPKLELPVIGITSKGKGIANIEARLSNKSLEHGFFAKEVGLFAKVDDGEECLYSYRYTGDYSEYVPAYEGGNSDILSTTYRVLTVVDNAENITVNLTGSEFYPTIGDFNDHRESDDPHPNHIRRGKEVDTFEYLNCDVSDDSNRLNYISLDNAKQQLLGGSIANIALLTSRLAHVEAEQAAIALKMEAENSMPDANMLLAENFVTSGSIDQLRVRVTSCAASDDTVDIESNYGIIVGSHYWITDSVHAEYVQVKSVIKNGNINRLLLARPLQYTYDIPNTQLYRTTSWIADGVAHGSGDIVGQNYEPDILWKGAGSTSFSLATLGTTQRHADNFEIGHDITFTASGLISLA